MDIYGELSQRIRKYSQANEEKTVTDSIMLPHINQKILRDCLMELGTVLEEDEKNGIYVAKILSGIFNQNPTVVGLCTEGILLYAAAYAKEGWMQQKSASKVLKKIFTWMKRKEYEETKRTQEAKKIQDKTTQP